MPLWIGNASLSVVAARDLGRLGPKESQPLLVEWRWYYHLPSVAIWLVVAALLVLVRDNRNLQAWTILIPAALLAAIAGPWIVRLPPRVLAWFCFASPGEHTRFAFDSLVGAWTALWLATPWLARCRAGVAFSLALAFMLLSGIAAYAVAFSDVLSYLPSASSYWSYLQMTSLWYGTCAVGMLLGIVFGGVSCRKTFSLRRFLAWMAIGILVAAFLGTAVYLSSLYPRMAERRVSVSLLAVGGLCGSLGAAAFTFLVNLPFVYLAHRCPCYRDRLRKVLRMPAS